MQTCTERVKIEEGRETYKWRAVECYTAGSLITHCKPDEASKARHIKLSRLKEDNMATRLMRPAEAEGWEEGPDVRRP